jgi:biotin carboxyl carrier protein
MKIQFRDALRPDAQPVQLEARRQDDGIEVTLNGRRHLVTLRTLEQGQLLAHLDGHPVQVFSAQTDKLRLLALGPYRARLERLGDEKGARRGRSAGAEGGELSSSMPGQVLKVLVREGDSVSAGQTLVIVEAMKMEHEIKAPAAGRVKKVSCSEGAMVSPGVALLELEPVPTPQS